MNFNLLIADAAMRDTICAEQNIKAGTLHTKAGSPHIRRGRENTVSGWENIKTGFVHKTMGWQNILTGEENTRLGCLNTRFPKKSCVSALILVVLVHFVFLGRVNLSPEIWRNSVKVMTETDFTYFFTSCAMSTKPVLGV